MEKTKEGTKKVLRCEFQVACNGYLNELLRMWELDAHYGYWNSDEPGTIYHYGETHNLAMEDIIYIVENDIEENEVLERLAHGMPSNTARDIRATAGIKGRP